MNLDDYREDLQQEVALEASREGAEQGLPAAFTERVLATMTEAGYIEDGTVAIFEARGMRASGFTVDSDEATLDVFITDYAPTGQLRTLGKAEVDTAFKRLSTFVSRCRDGLWAQLEESSTTWDMAHRIEDVWDTVSKVRLTLLTNARVTAAPPGEANVAGLPCSYHVWDVERLYKLETSGRLQEPITIDFLEINGATVPCLGPEGTPGDYEAFLLMLPGALLADIYDRFGSRLLELNVRSFLQARGKVNRGIQETLKNEPERFLAYNNGISMTASSVDLVHGGDGVSAIKAIHDVQIVNGGQTTASLHHAQTRSKVDLEGVFVQAKLSVVEPDHLQDLVPRISEYSNSQNKVNMADFSANDPFHVELEKLSRSIWAPGREGTQTLTRWFYERARGQYADSLSRERTPARQRQFKLVHPLNQKFTKTDVAKFENLWDQLPHVVSLGAEKNFREFMLRLKDRSAFKPDQDYFQRLAAKGLLFRTAESLVGQLGLGGYRAQTVAYTLALIGNRTAQRVNLDSIWASQKISAPLSDAIKELAPLVHDALLESAGTANISEWAKKPACWERVLKIDWRASQQLEAELLSTRVQKRAAGGSVTEVLTPEEAEALALVTQVGDATWFALASWAKETNNLAPWQRSLAVSLGRLRANERTPSRKQAVQGAKLVIEAARLGFSSGS